MCQILNKKIRIKLINIDKTNRRALHWNLYKQQQQLRQAKLFRRRVLLLYIDNFLNLIFVISCYIFMQMLSGFNFWNDVKAYNTNRFDIFFVVIQHSRIETMLVGFKEEIEFWNLIGLSYPSPFHFFKTRVEVHSFKYRYEYREQIGTKHRIAISAYISQIRGHFS